MTRRDLLRSVGIASAGAFAARALGVDDDVPTLTIAPEPLFDLSPWLYMQFMEPLGTTDGSVEAAWDHLQAALAARPDRGDEGTRAADDALGRALFSATTAGAKASARARSASRCTT